MPVLVSRLAICERTVDTVVLASAAICAAQQAGQHPHFGRHEAEQLRDGAGQAGHVPLRQLHQQQKCASRSVAGATAGRRNNVDPTTCAIGWVRCVASRTGSPARHRAMAARSVGADRPKVRSWPCRTLPSGSEASKEVASPLRFSMWPFCLSTKLAMCMELRYRTGGFEPYLFVDAGRIRINHALWVAGNNRRSIEGAGLGTRWTQGPWSVEATAGWRIGDDLSMSEPMADRLRALGSVGYRF